MCSAPARWVTVGEAGEAHLDFVEANGRAQMRQLLQLLEPRAAMRTEQRVKKSKVKKALGRFRMRKSVAKVMERAEAVVAGVG